MPLYKHDCDHCEYMGTFEGLDTYVCYGSMDGGVTGPSLLARPDDDPANYASFPLRVLMRMLENQPEIVSQHEPIQAILVGLCNYVMTQRKTPSLPE